MPNLSLADIATEATNPANAEEFHYELSGMLAMLEKILMEDHDARHLEGCSCQYLKPAVTTENREESSESVPSGNDGQREVYANASPDAKLPGSIFDTEASGEDSDRRHEATIQGSSGVERSDDSGDW